MGAVGNYEVVSVDVPLPSPGSYFPIDETVEAPSGKKILGGGFDAIGADVELHVYVNGLVDDGDGWRIKGVAAGNFSSGDKVVISATAAEMGECA